MPIGRTITQQHVRERCSTILPAEIGSSVQGRPCRNDEEDVGGDQTRSRDDHLCNANDHSLTRVFHKSTHCSLHTATTPSVSLPPEGQRSEEWRLTVFRGKWGCGRWGCNR